MTNDLNPSTTAHVENLHLRHRVATLEALLRERTAELRAATLLTAPPADARKDPIVPITRRQQIEASLNHRVQQLEALQATMQEISSKLDLATLLRAILKRAVDLLEATDAEISLYDADHNDLVVMVGHNMPYDYTGLRLALGEGSHGYVAQTRRPLIIANYLTWEGRQPAYAVLGPKTLVLVPLLASDCLVGVIGVGSVNLSRSFGPCDVELLSLFAQQATIAIQNAQFYEATRQRAQEAETLRQAAAVVTSTLNLEESLERILEQLAIVVPHDSGSVQLISGQVARIVGGRGYPDIRAVIGLQLPLTSDTPNAVVYQERQPYLLNDASVAHPIFQQPPHNRIRSWMGVPLIFQERMIGMLTLDSVHPDHFTNDHVRLAQAFADQVAIALENVRLFTEVQQLALVDALTGLYNRRHFFTLARHVAERAVQSRCSTAIIILDLDDFKNINDIYGHTVGDQVLVAAAHCCRQSVRSVDIVARYGGEEFIILLPETDQEHAGQIAESVRINLMQMALTTTTGPLQITASLGAASSTFADTADLNILIEHADQALQVAKHLGKNWVVNWSAGLPAEDAVVAAQATQRSHRYTSALLRVAARLNAHLDLPTVLRIICEETRHTLQVTCATIQLYDPEQDELRCAMALGTPPDYLAHVVPTPRAVYDTLMAQMGRVVIIPDLQTMSNLPNAGLHQQMHARTFVSVPMRRAGNLVGILNVGTVGATRTFTNDELALLQGLADQAALAITNANLYTEMLHAYDATLEGWSRALELRDRETEGHSQRVTTLTMRLVQLLGIAEEEQVHIHRGALLHDIGKMGIPDGILLKPGPLTPEEWVLMQKHPIYAYEMLAPIAFLRPALDIPRYHHEKWDGSGYPYGLRGAEIPLAARIFAVVDVWDALQSDRPYRPAWTDEQIRAYIGSQAGSHFDPEIVAAFLHLLDSEQSSP
jgi:diguanylate cyclase (GGDEF)-like protein